MKKVFKIYIHKVKEKTREEQNKDEQRSEMDPSHVKAHWKKS